MTQVVKFSVRDLGKHGHEVTCRAEVLEEKGERRDTICGHYPDKQDAIRAACVEYMKRNLFSLGFVVVEAKEAKVENRIADLEKINKDLADKLAESNSKVRHLNTVCDSKASAYVSLDKAFSKKSAELFEKETALDTTRKELESLRRRFRLLGGIA